MARTGRKPLPVEIHEMQGSYKKNPQRRKDSPKGSGRPQKPRHLDGIAAKEWTRIVKLLDKMGVLSETDAPTIEQYCEAYSDWRLAKEKVLKSGIAIVSKDKAGNVIARRNPFMIEKRQAAKQCAQILIELGMSPSSRTRLQVEAQDTGDDWFDRALRNRAQNN